MIEVIIAMQLSTSQLDKINMQENRAHVAGSAWLGPDRDADYTWDCENYADAKRQRLIREGANPSEVKLHRVIDETGVSHMITVYKDRVLDNRFARTESVESIKRYGYQFQEEIND